MTAVRKSDLTWSRIRIELSLATIPSLAVASESGSWHAPAWSHCILAPLSPELSQLAQLPLGWLSLDLRDTHTTQ